MNLTFLAPSRLWLLLLVAVIVGAQVLFRRRRRRNAVRHTNVAMVAAISPRHPGWRRHVTTAFLMLALVGMVLGLARPSRAEAVPREDAVIMLALDTSSSMAATDVAPSRIQVAVDAAKAFVAKAPSGYRIGLVTFDGRARLAVPPTTDRAALTAALTNPTLHDGTSAGDAINAAIDAIDAVTKGQIVVTDENTDAYKAIVLLSDGQTSGGTPLDTAAAAAKKAKVPVFTVAYGTPDGVLGSGADATPVPADPSAMAALAKETGASTYTAANADALAKVYDRITARIATVIEPVEVTVVFAAAAALALSAAFIASLVWSPRLT